MNIGLGGVCSGPEKYEDSRKPCMRKTAENPVGLGPCGVSVQAHIGPPRLLSQASDHKLGPAPWSRDVPWARSPACHHGMYQLPAASWASICAIV